MNFDRVYLKSLSQKFKFDEQDHDFNQSSGWVEYFATDNVPESISLTDDPKIEESENLSSIRIDIDNTDVKTSYSGPTYVPYGDDYVEYEHAGYSIDDIDFDATEVFLWDGDFISKETYKKINKISDDELEGIITLLKNRASSDYEDWINENYECEPPEPDNYGDDDF